MSTMADGLHPSNRPRRQRDLSNIPGFNHSRRSWTSGGLRMTMETASYTSPGFSFRNSADRSSSYADVEPSRSSASRGGGSSGGLLGGGLLGGAINLLNNVANPQSRRPAPRTQPERVSYIVESDYSDSDVTSSDEDLAYGSLPRARGVHAKSMLGRVKDRILEHGRPRANQPTDNYDDTTPAQTREPRLDRRRVRPESPEPPRASRQRRSSTWNYDKTPESSPERRSNAPLPSKNTELEVKTLQRAVESERKQYLDVKHRFQQASQQSVIDPEHIQDLLNQVKVHGALLASAQRKLQRAKERLQREAAARPQRQRAQRRPPPPREAYYESDEDDGDFEPWPSHGFGVFTTSARSNVPFQEPLRHTGAFDPLFGFRVFDRLFTEADSVHSSANGFHHSTGTAGPSSKRTTSYSNTGPSQRPNRPRSYHYAAPPQPPPELPRNPLRATEAARLFASYNSSWNSLSATFPTIPYPTRTLRAPALSDPSTIPHQSSHTWSTEQVMQANTALFFLIALGLNATISEFGIVTFDRATTPEADVRALLSVLKKEKLRWHSDRLGRRNEEIVGGGLNEALQRDERARAVFHGVCALMEFALGREG
ncbi:hypothetical protein Q7P35_008532 [Cladosporium inversicolor]